MKSYTFASCLGMIVSIALVAVIVAVVDGWALSTIWNWFMPTLFQLPVLTIAQAIGVSMVIGLFVHSSKSNLDLKDKSFGESVVIALTAPVIAALISVSFAWVVLQFAF